MVFKSEFAKSIFKDKYSHDGQESWGDCVKRVVTNVIPRGDIQLRCDISNLMRERKVIPGGRYLYCAGRPKHQVCNCFLARAKDTREGWGEVLDDACRILMTGGGFGVEYSDVRPSMSYIKGNGGISAGPIPLMKMVAEVGRYVMMGGSRRSAIWAGLSWEHKDIHEFIHAKDWDKRLRAMKEADFTFPLPLENTNISVSYDTEWWERVQRGDHEAWAVYMDNVRQALKTSEPGMSFNWLKDRESLRNPCCEVVSEDDGDKCNLGTVWMNHCTDIQDFRSAIRRMVKFMLYGNLYTMYPTEKNREVGMANNRIGLGLGGMHEWLMQRGMSYEVTPELHEWLKVYREESDAAAHEYAHELHMNTPKGIRAIAPTGTIGILAETTTGIEPLFCKAYKRRYLDTKANVWKHQYVVDGAVKRLAERGIDVRDIQDAYDLTFEQRVKFQADVQDYVDMAISSTCNIPAWGSELNNESTVENYANILYKYSKRLRGFTMYADGSRGGQPLTRVPVEEALSKEGMVFEERLDECAGGVCGV